MNQPFRTSDLDSPFKEYTKMSEPRCPYCNKVLDKKPTRKKKCPHCGNYIYVRRGQLMTLEQVEEYEARQREEWNRKQWLERLGKYGVTEQIFKSYQMKLSNEFGTQASINDTVWRILNTELGRATDAQSLRTVYYDMAELLRSEGKNPVSVLEKTARLSLLELQQDGVTHVTISTANDTYVCDSCKAMEGKVIAIDLALRELPIPHVCTSNGGCRCMYLPVLDYDNEPKAKRKRKKRFGLF